MKRNKRSKRSKRSKTKSENEGGAKSETQGGGIFEGMKESLSGKSRKEKVSTITELGR